jgi:hypothetical protein
MTVMLLTGALLLLAGAIALSDWRLGLFAAVPVGLLQDPLRKLIPGQPVEYVVLVGVVIAIAAFAATMSNVSLLPNRIRGWRNYLATPFAFFLTLLILQAVNTFVRSNNVIIPMIGFLSYLTPFVALGLVYQMVLHSPENFLTKFLKFYIFCVLLVLPTIALQFIGYRWSVLGEVGQGILVYDQHTVMSAYSGLFRASEIAAWHAGTCACFLIILTVSRPMKLTHTLLAGGLLITIIGLGVLTGRRKFLVEIVVFASAYLTLLCYYRRNAWRLAVLSGLVGLMGFSALALLMPNEQSQVRHAFNAPYEAYVERGKTGFGAVPDRFAELGIAPIGWAYRRYGLLGAGLGSGSQGSQQFGGLGDPAAEGGLGKISLELGVPGLVIVIWLALALLRHLFAILRLVNRQSQQLGRIAFGLTSFLIANIANFIVATQAYGDIFALLLVGTALGALMAMPVLAQRALQKRVLRLMPYSGNALVPHPV